MRASGLLWTPSNLERFLANPQAVVPGTRMKATPLRHEEVKALVTYLTSLR